MRQLSGRCNKSLEASAPHHPLFGRQPLDIGRQQRCWSGRSEKRIIGKSAVTSAARFLGLQGHQRQPPFGKNLSGADKRPVAGESNNDVLRAGNTSLI
jgi:hypothetical protein